MPAFFHYCSKGSRLTLETPYSLRRKPGSDLLQLSKLVKVHSNATPLSYVMFDLLSHLLTPQ